VEPLVSFPFLDSNKRTRSLAFRKCAGRKSVSRTHFPFSTSPRHRILTFSILVMFVLKHSVCRFSGIGCVSLDYLKGHVPRPLNIQRIISHIMAVKLPKRRSERLSRRKSTLINKAHELAEFCDVDVALIIRNRQTGRYFTYSSVDLESWPPSKEQIASHQPCF
jgi:hypothetical protein